MERVQKKKNSHEHEPISSRQIGQRVFADHSTQPELASRLDNSPLMVAQRKRLQKIFGGTAQLSGTEAGALTGNLSNSTTSQRKESAAVKPNNSGLPDNLKNGIEALSGISMDGVNVHYNSAKPAQLNALAYAQGGDIHVAPGQEQHLPHEAWHVVQQAQGRVKPTMQMKDGTTINDDKSLEHEADVMGARAGHSLPQPTDSPRNVSPATTTAQLTKKSSMVLEGEDVVDTDTKINTFDHNRSSVHGWAKDEALAKGPFQSVPSGAVCNHHWGYEYILDDFLNTNVLGFSISDAAKNTMISLGALNDITPLSTHKNSLKYAIEYQHINRQRFIDAMHYYILKICDYPGNLFYWPDHDGNEPDYPGNAYTDATLPHGWDFDSVVNSAKKGQKVFDKEIERIIEGADEIKMAIA